MNPLTERRLGRRGDRLALPADRPVEVELGCGDGQFLLERARAAPDGHYVGVEIRQELADAVRRAVAPIDATAADALAAIPYTPVAVVHMAFFESDFPAPARGFGFLAAPGERAGALGAIFASSLFPGRAPAGAVLLSAMVGGVRRPELVALSDDELVEIAREDASRLLGAQTIPFFARVVRHERAIPQYVIGHVERVAAADAAETRHAGLVLCGNAYRGVGLHECVREAPRVADRIAALAQRP